MPSYTDYLSLDLVERGAVEWHDRVNSNFQKIDVKFGPSAGHSHNGTIGSGPRIAHSNLSFESNYAPTNTHAQIDTHIADTSQHPVAANTKIIVSNLTATDPAPTVNVTDSVYIKQSLNNTLDIRFPRAVTVKNPTGNILVVDTGINSGGTGPSVGVPEHLPSTYAPVVSVDRFAGMTGRRLADGDWFSVSDGDAQFEYGQGEARIYQKLSNNGIMTAKVVHRIKSAVPHCEVQRVTLTVAEAVGGDSSDSVSIQLALMASSRIGLAHPSRLGIFLKIEVTGTTVKRSIYSLSGEPVGGSQTVVTWWSDTGTADSVSRNIRGTHEFSLDRNHRLHYYYNNAPVDISGGTNDPTLTGALTATVQGLVTALSAERVAVHPAGSSVTYLPVSPKFGRFGFDAQWNVSSSVKYSLTNFSASSTDDENTAYLCTNVPPAPSITLPATLPRLGCCSGGNWSSLRIGDFIDLIDSQVSGSAHPVQVRRFVVTDLVGPEDPAYPDGTPSSYDGGFLYAEVLPNGFSQRYVEFCDLMGNTAKVYQNRLARTNSRAQIRIEAERIPSLILEPSFAPISTTENIAPPIQTKPISSTFIPSNTRTYAVPIPYPNFANPASTNNTTVWPITTPLNGAAIKNIEYKRLVDGSMLVDFDVGDLPPGSFLSVTLVDALRTANTLPINVAVPILPNRPEITSVRLFRSTFTNNFTEVSSLGAGDNYIVITGKNFPLGELPEGGTLWSGYPLTGSFDTFKAKGYSLIDAETNTDPTFASVSSFEVHKGTYYPLSGTWSGGFSPTNQQKNDDEGVTAFLKIAVTGAASVKNIVFRLQHLLDTALPPSDVRLSIPALAANFQYFKVTESSVDNTSANSNTKVLTVYATEFNSPTASIVVNPGSATIGSVTYASSPSRATMNVTTPTAGNIVIRISNTGGTYFDIGWTVGNTKTPSISAISPATVNEGTAGQVFSLTCTSNSLLTVTEPPLNAFRAYRVEVFDGASSLGVVPITAATVGPTNTVVEVPFDVPNAVSAADLTFKVINPNGNVGTITSTIAVPPTPSITSIASSAAGGQVTGFEPGTEAVMTINGTDFLPTATATPSTSGGTDDFEFVGTPTITSTTIERAYRIKSNVSPGLVVTITVDNNNGTTADTSTVTVTNPIPTITSSTFATYAEGEQDVTGTIYGDNIYKWNSTTNNYEVNIASVMFGTDVVSFFATRSNNAATPFAGTLDLSDIDIPADSASTSKNLVIKTASTNGERSATKAITVGSYLAPQIAAVRLYSGASEISDLIRGQSGYKIEIDGQNFPLTASITIGGAATAGTLSTPRSRTKITFNNVAIASSPTNTNVVITIGSDGNSSASLARNVATKAAPITTTITSIESQNVFSPTFDGTISIIGTNLTSVSSVSLAFTSGAYMTTLPVPYSYYGETPGTAVITTQTNTSMVLGVQIEPLLALSSMTVKLYNSAGTLMATSSPIVVQVSPSLIGFTGSAPSVSTTAAASISALFSFDGVPGFIEGTTYNPASPSGEPQLDPISATVSGNDITVSYTNPVAGRVVQLKFKDPSGTHVATYTYVTT
jgi:hypothetical protein